jgi:hypothetical protein
MTHNFPTPGYERLARESIYDLKYESDRDEKMRDEGEIGNGKSCHPISSGLIF